MTPSSATIACPPDSARAGPPVDLFESFVGADGHRGRRILGTLKILVGGEDAVAAAVPGVEAPMTTPGDRELAGAISGVMQDRTTRPRRRPDHWPPDLDLPVRCAAADALPNLLVRGEAVGEVPALLLRWWAAGRHDGVVIDIDGRYAKISPPDPGSRYIDVADASGDELYEVLQGRRGVSVLDFSNVPTGVRTMALGTVLSVVAAHRARTGHPHWMMIDDAETVLLDPGIPPHVLDLSRRGHCLVTRSAEGLPDSLTATIDLIVGDTGPVSG
jgi:hypothetical protein